MEKGVAVPYIIAIILGVIVIGVLAFWFISQSGKGSTTASNAQCLTAKAQFCTVQTDDNWQNMLKACGTTNQFQITSDTKGNTVNGCYDFCSKIIPGWTPINTKPECQKP